MKKITLTALCILFLPGCGLFLTLSEDPAGHNFFPATTAYNDSYEKGICDINPLIYVGFLPLPLAVDAVIVPLQIIFPKL